MDNFSLNQHGTCGVPVETEMCHLTVKAAVTLHQQQSVTHRDKCLAPLSILSTDGNTENNKTVSCTLSIQSVKVSLKNEIFDQSHEDTLTFVKKCNPSTFQTNKGNITKQVFNGLLKVFIMFKLSAVKVKYF